MPCSKDVSCLGVLRDLAVSQNGYITRNEAFELPCTYPRCVNPSSNSSIMFFTITDNTSRRR